MEEMLDIYTRDVKYLGVKTRSECHTKNPGFYHKPAWTWVYNSKNEILVQKRAMCKKRYAGYWDMACAGHVDAGETPKQGAIREAKEEIGLDVSEDDVKLMFEHIEDEVEEVKWLNFDDFKKLFYSDKWAPCSDEYKRLVIEHFEKIFNCK